MKMLRELFNSQSKESERLCKELAELEKTWPTVKAEYETIDAECITLAGKLAAARLAGSPTGIAIEAELKQRRWARDAKKHTHSRRRDELISAIERLTQPIVAEFLTYCLDRTRATMQLGNHEILETRSYVDGVKEYRISYNAEALSRLQEKIKAGADKIRGMRACSLSELRVAIEGFKKEYDEFDIAEVTEVTLNQRQYSDLNQKQEEPKFCTGLTLSNGETLILGESASDRIGRQIEKMKSDPIFSGARK